MALRARDRWIILAAALALTLAAARWAGSEDRDPPSAPPTRNAAEPAPRADRQPTGTGGAERLPAIELEKLGSRKPAAPSADPFPPRSWQALDQEEARKNAPPPPPPPPPQAPPLPFAYMGKLVEDDRTTVFLTRADEHFIVRAGDTIQGAYRVDAIGERSMSMTYLPLGQRQELAFPSEK